MKTSGDFKYYLDNESKTIEEIRHLVDTDMTVSVEGLSVHYSSIKKGTKIEKLLKVVEDYQKNNSGILKGVEFPFDYVPIKDVIYLKSNNTSTILKSIVSNIPKEDSNNIEGQKYNQNKLPISIIFKQFPDAIKAIVKCSQYGHNKYKNTDSDFLNFKRVKEGSKAYADAGLRHRMQIGTDEESKLPHQYHVAWNALAELQLWIEENKYE
jgi:hypothetical protein